MTPEQYHDKLYQQPDPKPEQIRKEKHSFRKFWALWVPLGSLAGFVGSLLVGTGAVFLPMWGVATFIMWAVDEGSN
jgi:hypothetical protein